MSNEIDSLAHKVEMSISRSICAEISAANNIREVQNRDRKNNT